MRRSAPNSYRLRRIAASLGKRWAAIGPTVRIRSADRQREPGRRQDCGRVYKKDGRVDRVRLDYTLEQFLRWMIVHYAMDDVDTVGIISAVPGPFPARAWPERFSIKDRVIAVPNED